nr:hypothetical protein [Pedobacter sp. ASV19]
MKEDLKKKEEQVEFVYETPADLKAGIETATYKNGNQIKRFKISGDREVIVRELIGRDMMNVQKIIDGDEDKYMVAIMHFATKIDGKSIPMEDFEKLKGKDFNKINIQVSSLNF